MQNNFQFLLFPRISACHATTVWHPKIQLEYVGASSSTGLSIKWRKWEKSWMRNEYLALQISEKNEEQHKIVHLKFHSQIHMYREYKLYQLNCSVFLFLNIALHFLRYRLRFPIHLPIHVLTNIQLFKFTEIVSLRCFVLCVCLLRLHLFHTY